MFSVIRCLVSVPFIDRVQCRKLSGTCDINRQCEFTVISFSGTGICTPIDCQWICCCCCIVVLRPQ